MVLDKSPEWVLDNNLLHIKNEFEKNIPSIILCSDPFHKAEFLNRLINSVEYSNNFRRYGFTLYRICRIWND